MINDAIVVTGLIAFSLLMWAIPSRSSSKRESRVSAFDHVPKAVFVGILAFSPLLAVLLVDSIGGSIDVGAVLPFVIIIAASGLPMSLLVAKILGADIARFHISLLELSFKMKIQQVAVFWIVIFGTLGLASVLLYWM